ncbi:MAG: ABC transporter permease subunit [Candidatus Nanopelagicaceae bacterium]|nr:ABC transporter permease subunit [Candidatus Nanopelagicaceae bacterium]
MATLESKEDIKARDKELRARRKAAKHLYDGGVPSVRGQIIKIIILGLIDAFAGTIFFALLGKNQITFAVILAAVTLIVNWIYLRKGGLPAKYLAPGVILLICFQIYTVIFSGYISFTNYGSLHNGNYEAALNATMLAAVEPVEGASEYDIKIVKGSDGVLQFLATDFNTFKVYLGGANYATHPIREVTDSDGLVKGADGTAESLEGYTRLNDDQITNNAVAIIGLKVPLGPDIANDGFLATSDGYYGAVNKFSYTYDEATKTITTTADDRKYVADDREGFFIDPTSGEKLNEIGWRTNVGWKNFQTIFTDKELRGPLLGVLLWTFQFAILTVLSTFVLGLILALLLNDERIKGLKIYRSILILPYAFPAFLSAYVWKGMYNTDRGFINNSILHLGEGNKIPWLEQQGPARAAILIMNLWLGFPYMFLITTGALQAIPADLSESASIDGASSWQTFRLIKLPLLLVSLTPLLIASFAYNFNNFTVIYLLTGGGPVLDPTLRVTTGATDILITFVYRIAFGGGVGANYGLASAFSVLIFFIIGGISFFSFKRTRSLEEATR